MKTRIALPLLFSMLFTAVSTADELRVLPAEIKLDGPAASQRLLVLVERDGKFIADVTAEATWQTADNKVVKCSKEGIVKGKGNGQTTITAKWQGQSATANLDVTGMSQETSWSFSNHVIPILTKLGCNSGACHGALAGKGGLKLSLRGYAPQDDHFVLTRQAKGRRVDLVNPERSLLLRKPTLAVEHGGGQKLNVDSPEFAILADWIAAGAPGPNPQESKIVSLEIFPKHAVLKPKQSLQLVVRANYSDGSQRDVTRWAKFNSTEDLVAGVSSDGRVTVSGHGEAAITVLYSNLVGLSQITSPFPNPLDSKIFAEAQRNNFIDEFILSKLESLHIPPSPQCDDQTFLRRVYLDAIGKLPTEAEMKAFLQDADPKKRERLIDSLLDRTEFVDYWSYKWSDVFLVSSRQLNEPAMWAYYQSIRQSVADNKPWDQFAREILTATGSNLRKGATNYFVLHTDVVDLTETTAVTFMGMSITCARCHNHPMEKWTQDQYWSMANLFSRVAMKTGDASGEMLVQARPVGDVLHLRKGIAMPPTPLDGQSMSRESSQDRRKYFADWLTSKDNPYFAKALVNRVWKNFMGRGLVEAEDDLRETNPPTNPELLDALAKDFVAHEFDVKHLMRRIMNSAAYQRSSRPLPANAKDDRFYSRYFVRRLMAEVILDAYSQVTRVPTKFNRIEQSTSGRFSNTAAYPEGTRALQLPDTRLVSPFLDSFGRPERGQTCSCERQQESNVSQALHLNNGKTLNDRLRSPKSLVSDWAKSDMTNEDVIERLFFRALTRQPTIAEKNRLLVLMKSSGDDPSATRQQVLEDVFWAVLSSREFLFNH